MKKIILILLISLCSSSIAQWQTDQRLTNANNNSATSYNNARSIAAAGNSVHVIWTDNRGSGDYYQIFYKRSIDGGVNWSLDSQLTINTWYLTGHPSITAAGADVHLSWIYNHNAYGILFYKGSTDGGFSWTPNLQLTNTSFSAYYPSIAVSGSFLHIGFSFWQPSQIYYTRSVNSGAGWTAPAALSTLPQTSFFPSVSASGSMVHSVWQDNRNGIEIYYIRSTNDGESWGNETRLTNDNGNSLNPCLSSSGSLVHASWQDDRNGNTEIYYKRSTDGGLSWQAEVRLTNSPDSSNYPSIFSTGSNVHAVWQDKRDGNLEIYYKSSTDGGINWSADLRLTNSSLVSQNPSVTVSGTAVYVVWSDNRDGNFEVYFKRNPTGNPLGVKSINSEIPNQFSLFQNYPNPFNPTTNLRFEISDLRFVKLVILDLLGREVATLVNEQLQPGTYEASWDASEFGSGVYYYRINAGEYTETKKMILIK